MTLLMFLLAMSILISLKKSGSKKVKDEKDSCEWNNSFGYQWSK